MKRVVITGMGVLAPNGNSVGEMWESLCNGRSGIGCVSRFDASSFSSRIGGEVKGFDPGRWISPKEAKRMDRFAQFAVCASRMAVSDAGIDLEREEPQRIAISVGSAIGGIQTIEEQHSLMATRGPQRISPFFIPMILINMAPGLIAMQLKLRGPSYSIVSGCASAAHAIGEAWLRIRSGTADVMITGGSDAAITPLSYAGFCAMKALSTRWNDTPEKGSRPFDRERDGFVLSEGAGIIILEELDHARRRGADIHAELIGYGSSTDAYHMTAPAPGGEGAVACMREALRSAAVNAEDVGYVNAHGTSTVLNDKLETMAVKKVFGPHAGKLAVSSNKSMLGHLQGAAGAVELISTAMTVKEGVIPPTINYENPDPECDLDYVPNVTRDCGVAVAISNSFGFGGHNVTLVVRRFTG
jgi:3-oxoacyl-[acyl-carrier-protein] synthase II